FPRQFRPELPWEKRCIEAPTVIERNGKLFMFYAGGFNNDPQQIGVAVSTDGIQWTRLWTVPFIPNGPKGQWNASESGHPGVFLDDNGQTWLFFQGNNTHGKDWFISRVKIGWRAEKDGMEYPFVELEEKP
ncbi:MAG: glycoside hydrolase, partial [Planctomycetaceae bacterium]|nr:glycoside hydrolase [Planctomycetaceae bacterium]